MIGYKINVNSLKDKNMYKSFINASQIGELQLGNGLIM